MGWFRSLFGGGDKPEGTGPASSEPDVAVTTFSPPSAAPPTIRVTTTSTTGRETTVEIDLSAASEEPLLSIEDMEREIAAAERQRRKAARVSKVRGKHFSAHVDEIQALRRAERYDEALELLFECIAATERADEIDTLGRAPAYTEWAAMTLRKQKRYEEEVAVIERFFTGQKNPARANHPKLTDRLAKARDLRDAALTADAPPACPSCGSMLDVVPKARGKCGSCGQQIVARKIAGQTRVVTPEQADVLKAEETALRARRKYLLRVGSWQVHEAAWDAAAASLSEQYGRPASLGDVYWRLMNEATLEYQAEADWARAGQVYSDMAKFLVEEGRDWVHIAELRETMTQRWHLQYHEPETELILIACSCGTCTPDHLSVLTLQDALTAWPLPHAECTAPPCSCRLQRKYY